jgi:virginiamycin A acetyltransferase
MLRVTVGDGSIIGSCSLVTNDVPLYSIVGGNPAKLICKRFDTEVQAILEQLAWCNLPEIGICKRLQQPFRFYAVMK